MIVLKGIEKKYKDFHLNCSLEVNPGRIVGLVGQNGSGKSTTFKSILGLVRIEGGEIRVFGKEIGELTTADKEEIGVVLADSGFSGYLSVKDLIPVLKRMYKKFHENEFRENCRRYGIPLDKKIKEFSTGMKTKLKVLVAVSYDAKLLILDEPTSGVDVLVRDDFLKILQEYMEGEERAILISSHISSDLEKLCDELYMIHDGNIILHEDTDLLLSQYGVLKVTQSQFEALDKKYLLKVKKEKGTYLCLTNERAFYLENYPELVIEKSSIDEMILLMIRGERV